MPLFTFTYRRWQFFNNILLLFLFSTSLLVILRIRYQYTFYTYESSQKIYMNNKLNEDVEAIVKDDYQMIGMLRNCPKLGNGDVLSKAELRQIESCNTNALPLEYGGIYAKKLAIEYVKCQLPFLKTLPSDSQFGSHLFPLAVATLVTTGPILEMGIGRFSTRLLHEISISMNRTVLSADTDQSWIDKLIHLRSKVHSFQFVPVYGAGCFGDMDQNEIDGHPCRLNVKAWDLIGGHRPWSVVFIDHRPALRRRVDVQRFRCLAEIVVVHDTEFDMEYEYESVFELFKYKYTYMKKDVWTTLLSNYYDFSSVVEILES